MILKYYKHNDLKYASRKRILNIDNYLPFAEEIQYKVLLGDGAKTSIKTKTENICDYVTIEDTRWFVYDHIFMNGGQVTMHLIRDVIGEFGLDNCFGKIERGVTNSLLKYRKELGLNQILKDRKKIYPDTKRYAMVETNSHNEEMWGVLYFVKPKEEQTFNIPNLEIEATTNLTYNPDGIEIITNRVPLLRYTLYFRMEQGIDSIFSKSEQGYKAVVSVNYSDSDGFYISSITTEFSDLALNNTVTKLRTPKAFYGKELDAARVIAETMINNVINGSSAAFTFPAIKNVSSVDYSGYNNGITKDSEKFYRINVRSNIVIPSYGRTSSTNCDSMISEGTLNLPNSIDTFYIREVIHSGNDTTLQNSYQNYIDYYYQKVSFTEIGNVNQGTFLLDYSVNYVDEPFVCKVIPLYDCQLTIYNSDNTVQTANKNISKTTAFKVFNDIIAVTSGENPYLVDAQIYPYCPDLLNSPQDVEGIPVFDILSTTYIRNCSLLCNSIPDVKKDYICRELSIISPDQSNKYDFNYYDYSLEENIEIKGNENIHPLICQIKTALKPYNIISSFVIIPENGSLKNMSYSSDLRGSQPTGSGFETTLVTDQFQQYVRNNSNSCKSTTSKNIT